MSEIHTYDSVRNDIRWRQALGVWTDVYFQPEWLTLHLFDEGAVGLLFEYKEGDAVWLYAFVKRPIPTEYGQLNCFDIESAYGYGGPLSSSDDEEFLKRSRGAFEKWCIDQGIVAEFCAFHPMLSNEKWMLSDNLKILTDRETVALNLGGENPLSDNYSADGRYMCRRGQREGIRIEEVPVDQGFDRFVEMYLEAMQRLNASKFYLFNGRYFEQLEQLVRARGWLMAALKNEEWVAASLFLHGDQWLHYHLSANNMDVKAPGATNMLLDAAAHKGCSMGLTAFHLGGGRTNAEKDSLLKFKASMGKEKQQFKIGKAIHHPDVYHAIIKQWEARQPEQVASIGQRLLRYRSR
ncbi:GNAT family N-acetyltransferase [Verrucomicrobiaceae bacterium N1E253]|uniref:GNAT family N-acetyltransferase n=1 Tax=Oceaniferula marina TaxID=2748318 RepID=A0A851GCL5_9BACT|nr:GNAT family N-acetyltransferase [Oceaniferula marina]NWK55166.1 GNAT family N-acetyltransferase [Oceaniferula marina]